MIFFGRGRSRPFGCGNLAATVRGLRGGSYVRRTPKARRSNQAAGTTVSGPACAPRASARSGLNKIINRLREAHGDVAENPRFIETLPQRGYRFLAPVETVASEVPSPPFRPEAAPTISSPPVRAGRWFLLGLGLAALILIAYAAVHFRQSRIQSIAVLPLANLSGDPAQEYFSDGLTDELIGEISRIRSCGGYSHYARN
jgi:hypothetical protein